MACGRYLKLKKVVGPFLGFLPWLGLALCLGLPTLVAAQAPASTTPAWVSTTPDLVLVQKSKRKLYLLRGEEVLKEYPIALGFNPIGDKEREGDGRTPEGRYILDWRNPDSKFYRSIHISYPNETDIREAAFPEEVLGEYIMIHGSPDWVPSSEWAANWLQKENWTEGCIAVTNEEMDEIWRLVPDGTPIEIWP